MELVIRGVAPLSYNSKRKDVYQKKIRSAFLQKFKGNVPKFPTGIELYAKAFFSQVMELMSILITLVSQFGML